MNNVENFKFEGFAVRTVEKNREIYFVAKDVCDVLGLSDVSMTVKGLDDDEKGTSNICTLGGEQKMLIINESGLYHLIFKSRKKIAQKFRKWVTSEVLPAIRKTGSYSVNSVNTALEAGVDRQVKKVASRNFERLKKSIGIHIYNHQLTPEAIYEIMTSNEPGPLYLECVRKQVIDSIVDKYDVYGELGGVLLPE
jgi:prophage antirepressor-like protein